VAKRKKNRTIDPKRWNFGEGYGILGQPGALKVEFQRRKLPFSSSKRWNYWRDLMGSFLGPVLVPVLYRDMPGSSWKLFTF